MKKLFLRIDLLKDFMYKGGKLYIEGANNILNNTMAVSNKIETAIKENPKNNFVAFVADQHDGTEEEMEVNGGKFPLHCMKGTEGAEFIDEAIISNAVAPCFFKQTYNVSSNNSFIPWMNYCKFDEVYVDGVVGNICVEAAVNTLVTLKHIKKIFVFENAVKWIDMKQGIFTDGKIDNKKLSIERMKNKGVKFIKI